MNRLTTPWGDLGLTRFPDHPRETLRAWDAADEYLLRHLAGSDAEPADLSGPVAVVGDRWGALTTALAARRLDSATSGPLVQITDSYLTQRATRANLARAGVGEDAVRLLSARDTPPERIDLLLVRIPKSLALLEDQLHRLAPAVHPGTTVLATGRVTEIHTSTLKLFEQILGPTTTSLAVRKARLIFCAPAPGRTRTPGPWPHRYALPDEIGSMSGRTVVNHAGIFCAERLDIGTRFLLRHLPHRRGSEHVVDLGCGNGVVGTAMALDNPAARVTFIDESFSAVASAEATFRENAAPDTAAEFVLGDSLTDVAAATVDLVLNNPPFHTHQATTDATAWRMFTGSRAALRPGGELWVVGNRHLGYHAKLRRLFGNCETVTSDPKFVVLRAVKR
ncbi:methyltransferase [Streptomyces corynorhini]|uniref:Ribosomal RNA large subunit methyltransferase G n=1 Tax=Streptomyces corynorhini TaxID=2282652 RepID=A0A370BF67_9ACTN|nr:methyltransferase [Streptomyces corynorhini]RDG38346.1 methyltransferase domain-containing protein [Streptomyces corynorhini]